MISTAQISHDRVIISRRKLGLGRPTAAVLIDLLQRLQEGIRAAFDIPEFTALRTAGTGNYDRRIALNAELLGQRVVLLLGRFRKLETVREIDFDQDEVLG